MAIQNIIVNHQSTIYGAPQFDIWISIIQFMKIHNYELRCCINAPDSWSYRIEIWSFIFKIMELHNSNMELYRQFIELHKSIVERHMSATEVHDSYLWSSIILNMELHNYRYDMTDGYLSIVNICIWNNIMELQNCIWSSPNQLWRSTNQLNPSWSPIILIKL